MTRLRPLVVLAVAALPTVALAGPPARPATTPVSQTQPATVVPVPPAPATGPRVAWPETVTGRVLDAERKPAAGASIVFNGTEVRASADGTFTLPRVVPDARVLVKMPGYEKVVIEPTRGPVEVVLKPQTIKAAYLTYYGIVDKRIRERVLEMVARTELNAVVMDVKGDRGWIPWATEVPLAQAAGARGPAVMKDFDGLMAELKARGVYTIARIVTFKDNMLANHKPDWAVMDTRTGKPWTDREKLAWVDPFREGVWDYNIAIAKEAVSKGFDEVQFDYVRFPTDGKLSAARYSKTNNGQTRLPTIVAFLTRARREIGPLGAFVAADIFGYTAFNDNDTDIGQRIEEMAPTIDYLCPMVYPSGYHLGIPKYRNPVAHPYEVVYESVRLIRQRTGSSPIGVRPWIQDFRDYAFDRRIFGANEVRAQMRGAHEGGGVGWMLWNPRNDYTRAALRPKGGVAQQ